MFAIPWYTILLLSIPQTLLIIKIGFELFNVKVELRKAFLISIIIAFCTYFLRQLPLLGFHTVILVLLLTSLATAICKIRWWDSFIASLLGSMILGAVEKFTLPLFLLFADNIASALSLHPWFNVLVSLPSLITLAVIYLVISKKHFILYDLHIKEKNQQNLFSIVTVLAETFIILFLCHYYLQSTFNPAQLKWITFFVDLAVLILCIFTIASIKVAELNVKKNIEFSVLKHHLSDVENLLETLRCQKHEFTRHIQAIESMTFLRQYEKVHEYVQGIAENCMYSDEIIDTGHPAITALINSKHDLALSMGIEFAVSITCDLSKIYIQQWDMCSILGNLIDNAIEAAAQDTSKPRVGVEFKYHSGQYLIFVHNNGSRIANKNCKLIFNAGYTTKNSDGRGYGLYLTNKILQKYGGDIEVNPGIKTTFIVKLPAGGYENGICNF